MVGALRKRRPATCQTAALDKDLVAALLSPEHQSAPCHVPEFEMASRSEGLGLWRQHAPSEFTGFEYDTSANIRRIILSELST